MNGYIPGEDLQAQSVSSHGQDYFQVTSLAAAVTNLTIGQVKVLGWERMSRGFGEMNAEAEKGREMVKLSNGNGGSGGHCRGWKVGWVNCVQQNLWAGWGRAGEFAAPY